MADFSTTKAFESSLSCAVIGFRSLTPFLALALLGAVPAPSMIRVSTPFCTRIGCFPTWFIIGRHFRLCVFSNVIASLLAGAQKMLGKDRRVAGTYSNC